jgi:hypothetical protein
MITQFSQIGSGAHSAVTLTARAPASVTLPRLRVQPTRPWPPDCNDVSEDSADRKPSARISS